MKILLSLLLLISCELVTAQKITGSSVWITTVQSDTTYTEYKHVTMGSLRDKICIDVGYLFCLYDLKTEKFEIGITKDLIMIGNNSISERYQIRQVISSDGFTMWITNLDKGFPHWVISTRKPEER